MTFLFCLVRESECQTHAMACGAGTGAFLLIKVLSALPTSFLRTEK